MIHYNIYFQMAAFVFLAALALICLMRRGAHTLTRAALYRTFASALAAPALDVPATPVRAGAWPWLPDRAACLLLAAWMISFCFLPVLCCAPCFWQRSPGSSCAG